MTFTVLTLMTEESIHLLHIYTVLLEIVTDTAKNINEQFLIQASLVFVAISILSLKMMPFANKKYA